MIPRAAQIRQQQAHERRARLEESAARAAREDMFARHNAMNGVQRQTSRFANTNRYSRRDPNRGVITQAEWDDLVEKYEDSGFKFRVIFFVFAILSVALLAFAKYDIEYNLEPPQIESGKGFSGVAPSSASMNADEMEKYYETLGVKGRMRQPSRSDSDTGSTSEELERRRENFRVRKEIRRAYEQHKESRGQLVSCGRSCEAKNQQVELAYNRLASQVDRELYGVLLDTSDTKSKRSTDAAKLKEAYEAKKKELEEKEQTKRTAKCISRN
ncbi:hypothetical protein ERJ75_000949800 [Trypanosoma vivax]|nr:hypothetical protein ERJ75_000949800 [Trypanosoma vivax]